MRKIICVFAAAAMMSFCFVGCGNDKNGNNSAMDKASEAVSDVGSEIATIASDVVGDGTVSDTDGIIGNENNETSAVDNNGQDVTNATSSETNHNDAASDNELM